MLQADVCLLVQEPWNSQCRVHTHPNRAALLKQRGLQILQKMKELKKQIEALLYAHRKCDFEFTLGYETACKDVLEEMK
jgi:hypothetical protein